MTIIVQREGSSLRTGTDLCILFVQEAMALGVVVPQEDITLLEEIEDFFNDDERMDDNQTLVNYLEALADIVNDAESALSAKNLYAEFNDGFIITDDLDDLLI